MFENDQSALYLPLLDKNVILASALKYCFTSFFGNALKGVHVVALFYLNTFLFFAVLLSTLLYFPCGSSYTQFCCVFQRTQMSPKCVYGIWVNKYTSICSCFWRKYIDFVNCCLHDLHFSIKIWNGLHIAWLFAHSCDLVRLEIGKWISSEVLYDQSCKKKRYDFNFYGPIICADESMWWKANHHIV